MIYIKLFFTDVLILVTSSIFFFISSNVDEKIYYFLERLMEIVILLCLAFLPIIGIIAIWNI